MAHPKIKMDRMVGDLWANRAMACLFVMVKDKDWSAIDALLG